MKKKFTSIILSLFMIFSVFVGNISNVSAASVKSGVYIAGNSLVDTGNTYKSFDFTGATGEYKYISSNKALYLKDVNITKGGSIWNDASINDKATILINVGSTFTIHFENENTIKGENITATNASSYGIYSYDHLTIKGSENAILKVTSGNATGTSSPIYGRSITVDKAHIVANASTSNNNQSFGLFSLASSNDSNSGKITIKNNSIVEVDSKTTALSAQSGVSIESGLCNRTYTGKKVTIGHKLTKHDAVDAKCLEDGNELNYECETCHKRYKDSTGITEFSGNSYIKAKHVESLTYVGENDATCTSDGNVAYYHCGVCEKNYRDANGTNVITDIVGDKVCTGHDASFVPGVPATCTSDGLQEYYQCNRCNKYFTDEECVNETTLANLKISATGHDNPMVHKAYKAATCTEDGNVEYYYCSKCNKYFEDEEATEEIDEDDITLTKTGHSMQHVAKVPAKCEEDGCEEYYYCSRCDKYFRDEEGQNVVTLSGLKIDATGHDFDDGVVSVKDNVKTTTYTCKNCQTTKVVTEDIKEVISGNDKNDETKVDKKEETKVNTGDNSNLVLWFSLLALSIISLFVVRKSTVRR